MRKYTGIDIGRVLFACIIPLLHISFPESAAVSIVRQYLSRLGVPFFFAVSGMFLCKSVENYGSKAALKKYLFRIGRVLLIWLFIYLPIFIAWASSFGDLIQQILFKTPGYLWYLSGLLFAAVPFCLVKNRKALYVCAFVLYIIGTLFGGTYKWLLGGMPWYESIFLTTRNGLFFGLPLMCVGELTWKTKKPNYALLLLSWLALAGEVTFVGFHASSADDRSMYLLLPFCIFRLLPVFRSWNPQIKGKHLGGISSAIYVMQFGIITVLQYVFSVFDVRGTIPYIAVFLVVIIIPTALYLLLRNRKIVKVVF